MPITLATAIVMDNIIVIKVTILKVLINLFMIIFAVKWVGEFEAASSYHGKIVANIQNKKYLTVCPKGI